VPHFFLEYTDNIKSEARIPELLRKVNAILMAQGGVFPTGGIRSRAIELKDYAIADGAADYAFVHATLKIGAGRSEAEKKKACDELFAMMREHFAPVSAHRYLALSMEFGEFSEAGTYKQNNLHARFKKEQTHVG
jgi:5-carboxymethyl-2-hydroxymuconate isomerase